MNDGFPIFGEQHTKSHEVKRAVLGTVRRALILLIAAWSGCAILVGYPAIGMSLTAAVQSGLLAAPPAGFKVGGGFQTRVLLYGTFFVIPGILYGIAAWDYRRATSRARNQTAAATREVSTP